MSKENPEQEPSVGFVRCELMKERHPKSGFDEPTGLEIKAF